MKASSSETSSMAMGFIIIRILKLFRIILIWNPLIIWIIFGSNMKEISFKIKKMDLEPCIFQMESIYKLNGLMIELMDLEFIMD